ncbi:putative secretin GspD [subsurface metagenome]
MVIIESTNSLLVNATPEQHAQIAVIIGYVDSETLKQAIPYEIYALENQSPEDLAAVLQKLIQETIKDKEGKIQQVVKREEDIVIVPDENTFSLIVYASKKNQEWIESLIEKLDKRRPQVLIDVSLVEITRDDDFEYDLNIIANAKDAVTDNLIFGATSGLIAATGTVLEGGWNTTGYEGKIRGFYAEDKIQALLTAMDKKDYGRILARPKILVNDNEEGVIKTTEKTYIPEQTTSYPSVGTTGAVNPVYTYKYTPYEAKIELTITPHISEGNLLRLEVSMVREDFVETETTGTATTPPPDYTTSNIDTVVTVPDGSTIILGGLTKLKQRKAGSKVPLLGDIPLVGGLFRTIDNSDEANKLYVFVKANILRPDETVAGLAQLQQISAENRDAFEEAERGFQAKEDWPGIKPKPLDPLRVLEAD